MSEQPRPKTAVWRVAPGIAWAFLCAGAAAQGLSSPSSSPPSRVIAENPGFRVEVPADRQALAPALLQQCTRARAVLGRHTQVSFSHPVTVRWCETEEEFLRNTGQRPESVVAAASARRTTIWINGPAWQRTAAEETLPILIHEYAHVMVGKLAPVPLPRWADEGLAMHLAGQWTLGDGFAATRAQLFGGMPRLAQLESEFPAEPDGLRRAYLISYLAMEQFARDLGGKPGDVDPILERLQDPQKGRTFAESLREPETRARVQALALAALGTTTRKWVIYLSSGTTLWVFILALFLYAYWRKKRRSLAAAERERKEEPWAESLTQKDIEEIYGTPQDTVEEEDEEEKPWEQ